MVVRSPRPPPGHAGGDRLNIRLPGAEAIGEAGQALRDGRLIGMPTETVYGIAADATQPEAVRATFALKRRPADNPLIVHLASAEDLGSIVLAVPSFARDLAAAYWPGPLTLVMAKKDVIPVEVSAGLDTVAVRVPGHPAARDLIAAAGRPISAPSANLFMSLSPTRATDIQPEIAGGLAMILDGGACDVGLESTVVDCSGEAPRILRPGGISRAQIESIAGPLELGGGERRSPGMYPRHYAPRTPVRIALHLQPADCGLTLAAPVHAGQIQMPFIPAAYARDLYRCLREVDTQGFDEIVVEAPPETAEWEAIWDRLRKAATAA